MNRPPSPPRTLIARPGRRLEPTPRSELPTVLEPALPAAKPAEGALLFRLAGIIGRLILFAVLVAVFVAVLGIIRHLVLWSVS
jgi:hypothetical protein